MKEAFKRICEGLEQAIAHASGEEVEGVIIHHSKKLHVERKETHQNHNVHDSVMTA